MEFISINDRLPKDYQDVLVWEEHPGRDYALSWYTEDGGWCETTPDVTHWCPLPEPPSNLANRQSDHKELNAGDAE